MFRLRLLPIVLTLLLVSFTVRLGDFFLELSKGRITPLESASAQAAEDIKDDKKTLADPADKIVEKDTAPPKEVEVKGLDKDPFVSEYTEEEVLVLQSLSKRREELDKRARDIDQREKLLQAAEKKIDEKVAELEKLKLEIENLLQDQQKIQDERLVQLVKIYENMKPKDAANIFNEMNMDVVLGIVYKMSERKIAPILANMDPVRAREISRRLAEQKSLPKAMAN